MMAPESERARYDFEDVSIPEGYEGCFACGVIARIEGDCLCDLRRIAPLTCSEVVERLIQEAFRVPSLEVWFDRAKAEKILHSWRERRVQELEEAIKYMVPRLDQHEELPDWVREISNAL